MQIPTVLAYILCSYIDLVWRLSEFAFFVRLLRWPHFFVFRRVESVLEDKNNLNNTVAIIGKVQITLAILVVVSGIVFIAVTDNDTYSTTARSGSTMFFGFIVVKAIIMFMSGILEINYPIKGCWNLCMISCALFVLGNVLVIASKFGLYSVCNILGFVLGIIGIGYGKSQCQSNDD